MANKFERGKLVVLKSGGPPMTVDEVPGDHDIGMLRKTYLTKWFKGASKEQGSFSEHVLEEYAPPAKK